MTSSWDQHAFLTSLEPMQSLACELLKTFLTVLTQKVTHLNAALQDDDYKSIHIIAHSIKGSAAQLYFTQLKQLAQTLENNTQPVNISQITPSAHALIAQIKIEEVVIKQFLQAQTQ